MSDRTAKSSVRASLQSDLILRQTLDRKIALGSWVDNGLARLTHMRNDLSPEDYLPRHTHLHVVVKPPVAASVVGSYNVIAAVVGGDLSSCASALLIGIASELNASEESAEIKRLKRENAELKRANAILKAASVFFAAELDRPGQ